MKFERFFLVSSLAVIVGIPACFNPESSDTSNETDASTGQLPSTGDDLNPTTDGGPADSTGPDPKGSTGPDPDDTSTAECEGAAGTLDPNCSDASPYCLDGNCVGCGALPLATCADVDPDTPACNPDTGLCVECSDNDDSFCEGATPVCVDNVCAPCNADEQCESGLCLVGSGQCQPVAVTLEGLVLNAQAAADTPVSEADLQIANIDPPLSFMDTPASGEYEISDIPPGSLIDVSLDVEEGWAGDPNSAFRTVHQISIGLAETQAADLKVVEYNWLGQVALDCGVYDFGAGATQWDVICAPGGDGVAEPGCAGDGEGVSSFILTRSSVFGTLYEEDGTTPFTESLSRASLSVVMSNNGMDAANVENNPGDGDAFPFHVCWLDEQDGALVGSPALQNTTGHFVLFRVRNSIGLGQGNVAIEAAGFDSANVRLSSSGSIGVVRMNRNNRIIERDFAIDVYPMFEEWDCLLCHATGGVGATLGERDGFFADWSLSPDEVYDNIVGPGTDCDTTVPLDDPSWGTDPGVSSGRLRVCTNQPDESLLIMRPTAGLPLFNEVHPADIFPGPEHPQMEVVRQWVEQGANPPANAPVDFASEVYPIFTSRGCVTCHYACESAMPGVGCVLDSATNSFRADWNLPANEVYQNLTGPGTDCAEPATDPLRVCVNDPTASLLVVRPLAGVPAGDPHPVEIFPSEDDPDLVTIINWINQGALP